jgi:predicted kinase
MRRLINVCGLPGSGKSTFALWLAQESGGTAVAADDFFYDSKDEYHFVPALLKQAHEDCQSRTREAFSTVDTVVVHNTGVRQWERDVYRAIAQEVGAQYTEVVIQSGLSTMDLSMRNVHGVPREKITDMRAKFDHNL